MDAAFPQRSCGDGPADTELVCTVFNSFVLGPSLPRGPSSPRGEGRCCRDECTAGWAGGGRWKLERTCAPSSTLPTPPPLPQSPSVFPPVTGWSLWRRQGLNPGPPRPRGELALHYQPALPGCLRPSIGLARVTSDRWAACYLLDSALSRLRRGTGTWSDHGPLPETGPSASQPGGRKSRGLGARQESGPGPSAAS